MNNSAMIRFPHLGISIPDFDRGFSIFGIRIAFYGILIALSVLIAVILCVRQAKRTGQNPSDYYDLAIICVLSAIVGARIYYILFNIEYYIDNPSEILNIRNGGLAIYGGIIGGFIAAFIVCRVKKISVLQALDTAAPTIALGQAIGRWGNFFNLEAYGDYTDCVFAMQIRAADASGVITDNIRNHMVNINGTDYIQVHPTFLYESVWCFLLFAAIMLFRKYASYNGEILLWYLGGYGLERMIVEGLRTDSLKIGNTGIPVSQLLSAVLLAGSLTVLIIMRINIKGRKNKNGI
ncbi:MAG: prolipoprotein diacylglyceryl transferase [Parasporobacterium sp.]|nr:prolipoprotein diacylglyceryl transferase [Parasporobacterium sp.]